MAVSFNNIPNSSLRVPFVYFELNAGAAPYQSNSRLLLIGQKTAAGLATANEPILVTGNAQGLFGYGSHLSLAYQKAVELAPLQEIWCLPLADDATWTAASGTIKVAGAPVTSAGTIALYVAGVRLQIVVNTVMTNAQIATAIAAAINASTVELEATATASADTVTVTARNAGVLGNTIRINTRLLVDDSLLADKLLTITQPTGGAGLPDFTAALSAMEADEWDFIGAPYSDAASIAAFESFLDPRWLPTDMKFGAYITYRDGTAASLQTFGHSRNNPNITCYGGLNFESPPWRIAAAAAAIHASHLQDAPELSRPLQSLPLPGIRGPKLMSDRFSAGTKNTLLFNGISTLMLTRDGTVEIERSITMYQTNGYNQNDTNWLSTNTRAQHMYGIRFLKSYITQTRGRCALVDDNPNNLQSFVTADDIRNDLIHAYEKLVALGVYENAETFAALVVVERNQSDPNRVDAYLPVDVVNQLIIFAGNVTSFLQYDAAGGTPTTATNATNTTAAG